MSFPSSHPSLLFYRGDRRVEVVEPSTSPGEREDASGNREPPTGPTTATRRSIGVIQLHHLLFPPAPVGQLGEVADENYSLQLASTEGLEPLRLNWRLLLCLFFPCMLEDDPVSAQKGDAAEQRPEDAKGGDVKGPAPASQAATPASLTVDPDACVLTHVTTEDFDGLREPGMMDRMYYSFVVFLRFFGWRVHDEQRGVLDRHRDWQTRYRILERGYQASGTEAESFLSSLPACGAGGVSEVEVARIVKQKTREALLAMPANLGEVDLFDYYTVALLRILHSFLDFGFITLAVGLVEFLLDEMSCGRLEFLNEFVVKAALPCIQACEDVSDGHKKRLSRKLYKLTHSDSD